MLSVVMSALITPKTSGLVQRRPRASRPPGPSSTSPPKGRRRCGEEEDEEEEDGVQEEGEVGGRGGGGGGAETRLTLMEEVLLLGLKEDSGRTSFFNDCLSSGLRGCVLVELALRGRLGLEERRGGVPRGGLPGRRVVLRSDAPTGDTLLDETLRLVARRQPALTVQSWLDLLTGDTLNPLKRRLRLKNVRLRLAKGLAEKGVLTARRQSFLLFDTTTHPLGSGHGARVKRRLVEKVRGALLDRWELGDPSRRATNKRLLALVLMAHASNVLDNALDALPDERHDLAMARVRGLATLEAEAEASRPHANQLMWAVVASFDGGPRFLELL